MKVRFLGPTYNGRSNAIDPSRCINFYPELNLHDGAKSPISLIGTPGSKMAFDTSKSVCRGLYSFYGRVIVVVDSSVYTYQDSKLTLIGNLNTNLGPVSIKDNGRSSDGVGGNQVMIVDGKDGYIYNISTEKFRVIPRGLCGPLESIEVKKPGSGYTSVPEVTAEGGSGEDAKLVARMGIVEVEVTIPGKNYKVNDSIAIDGESISPAIVKVKSVEGSKVEVSEGGSGYVVGEVVSIIGGKGDKTFKVSVATVDAGAMLTADIYDAGSYTEIPTAEHIETTSNGSGTGAKLDVTWGVHELEVTDKGVYEKIIMSGIDGPEIDSTLKQDPNSDTDGTGLVVRPSWGVSTVEITECGKNYPRYGTGIVFDGGGFEEEAEATATATVMNGGFPDSPKKVEYFDGRFIVTNGTMAHWSSEPYDGMTFNPLAKGFVMATPDSIQNQACIFQILYFIKEFSTEMWYDAGVSSSVGTPLARIQGGILNYGTECPNSVVKGDDSLIFIGFQRIGDTSQFVGVVQLSGSSVQHISTPSINYRIGNMSRIDDAIAYFYSIDGHRFYVLTFPTADATLVYDTTTKMWHEWASYRESDIPGVIGRHFGNAYTYYKGKHYLGDYRSGKIFELSSNYLTDDGDPIVSIRVASIGHDTEDLENTFFFRFYIEMETGAHDPDLVSEPLALLSWSNDSGNNWSNEYEASIGKVGRYRQRLIWRRLGYAVNRVFKLTISDPIRKVLVDTYADID